VIGTWQHRTLVAKPVPKYFPQLYRDTIAFSPASVILLYWVYGPDKKISACFLNLESPSCFLNTRCFLTPYILDVVAPPEMIWANRIHSPISVSVSPFA